MSASQCTGYKVFEKIFLRDLLEADDFGHSVERHNRALSDRFGLPPATQLGVVVPDAQAADKALTRAGMPPCFLMRLRPGRWQENGRDVNISALLGLTYHAGYEVEPIEPLDNAEFYGRDVDPEGRIVVHHLGVYVRNLDYWMARLATQGFPLLVRGRLSLGLAKGEFAYFDTREVNGLITELIDLRIRVLGIPLKMPRGLVRVLGRLQLRTSKRYITM